MAIREILIYPDERLRRPTSVVTEFDDKLQALVDDMFETMYDDDGIGLAAPQIGISKKIVVIDIPLVNEATGETTPQPIVLINPEIVKAEGTSVYNEGCLSVPGMYEEVERAAMITLKAQNAKGEEVVYEDVTDLLCTCMQHELDHLQGKLFIDYLSTFKRDRITKALQKKQKDKARQLKEQANKAKAHK